MSTKNKNYKGFTRIDRVLHNAEKQRQLEPLMYRYKALKYWQQVAGGFLEEAEGLTKAVDFKNGVLWVACLSREIASKLKLLTPRIIEALNNILGRTVVYAINIEL